MDSDRLRPWQAQRVCDALRPFLRYLGRLQKRMEKRGFPTDDTLYRLVAQLHGLTQELVMELHYRSCPGGVGRERALGRSADLPDPHPPQ